MTSPAASAMTRRVTSGNGRDRGASGSLSPKPPPITTTSVSVMPAGLVDDLTAAEFASLVDYVVSLKPLH